MFKTTTLSIFSAVLVLLANPGYTEEMKSMEHSNMQQNKPGEGMQMHRGHGVVNKINARAGKVNITHEPIESMSWPKMTMDFSVQNKADLEAIKPGMAVDFDITMQGKGYRITRIAPAR